MTRPAAASAHEMHLGIAEAGKAAALAGDHVEALRHYREALRLAVSSRAPEVFFRHYTQCALESLELAGHYGDVIAFCERAEAHYREIGVSNPLQRRDRGSILERKGIALIKRGDPAEGQAALEAAVAEAGTATLPVSETVLGWLRRGLRPDVRRLTELQRRQRYFTVRPGQVDADRARPLPKPRTRGRGEAAAQHAR
ncbi:hypothetical protein [Roseitranquillus sediminis]|uniref:hypothetical protein n=1 Tax=Roseitranquillus sediminis TaxID=2809051 RepID=UPI001D0C21C5|nr:hypothetical protein [Roseitranquillus sediminis]MBM9593564.1 hypothetical protein [Roseitranquillus sediminis]